MMEVEPPPPLPCAECERNPRRYHKTRKCYSTLCRGCAKKKWSREAQRRYRTKQKNRSKKPYCLVHEKQMVCTSCGFQAQHLCQMDIDHIDGVKANNAPENLQTLCANCHRLKTQINRDWEHKTPKEAA